MSDPFIFLVCNTQNDNSSGDNADSNGAGGNGASDAAVTVDNTADQADKNTAPVSIEDEETAKAASIPVDETQQNKGFPWWIVILAAIAGVSVEEYARRKNIKAKSEKPGNKKN